MSGAEESCLRTEAENKQLLKALRREYRHSFLEGNRMIYFLGIPKILSVFAERPPYFEAEMRAWRFTMWAGPLTREAKEAIALAVSVANECPYCVDTHDVLLQASGMKAARSDRIIALVREFVKNGCDQEHRLSARFEDSGFDPSLSRSVSIAVRFTVSATGEGHRSRSLPEEWCGGSPTVEDIDALGVALMFNIVNRAANGLCVELELGTWRRPMLIGKLTRRPFVSLLRHVRCFDLKPTGIRTPSQNIRDLQEMFKECQFEWDPTPFEVLASAPHILEAWRTLIEASLTHATLDPALLLSVRKSVLELAANPVPLHTSTGIPPRTAPPEPQSQAAGEKERACLRLAADMVSNSYRITRQDLGRLSELGLAKAEILDLVVWTAVWFSVGQMNFVFAPERPRESG